MSRFLRTYVALSALVAVASWPSAAAADGETRFFASPARAVARTDGASRDVAAFEYAYGPRAQLSLGHALGIAQRSGDRGWHVWTSLLFGLEDASEGGVIPLDVGRIRGELGYSATFEAFGAEAFGEGGVLELGFTLGFERARALQANELDDHFPDPASGDIPFGGGGTWFGVDLAGRWPIGRSASLDARVGERLFFNAFAELFAGRDAGDNVASVLVEGLSHAPFVDFGARWAATESVQPVFAAFAEGLIPADESADASYLVRGLAGVALPGSAGEFLPFAAVELGSGKGLLINRHELRFSLGFRYVPG